MATEAEERARLEELNGRARLAALNAKANVAPPVVEEPPGPKSPPLDYAKDYAKIPPRVVKNTVDFPQEGGGMIAQGLDWLNKKMPPSGGMFGPTMTGTVARALASNALQSQADLTKPSEQIPEKMLETLTGRSVPPGESDLHDTALFAGELLGSTPRALLKKGASAAEKFRSIIPDMGSALGGGAGQAAGREIDERFDTGYAEPVAALIGSLLGGPAAIKATTPAATDAAQRASALINMNTADSPAPYLPAGGRAPTPEAWTGAFPETGSPITRLAERFSSPQAIEEGGTAAQVLGGDRAVQGLVNYAQPKSNRANAMILDAEAARTANTAAATENILGGIDDVAPAQAGARGLVRATQKKIIDARKARAKKAAGVVAPIEAQAGLAQTRALRAQEAQDAAEAAATGGREQLTSGAMLPGAASKQMHDTATLSRQISKEAEGGADELWAIVDSHPDIPTQALKDQLASKMMEMHPNLDYPSGRAFIRKYTGFMNKIDELPPSIPASEVQFLRSELSTALHNASTMGKQQMLGSEGRKLLDVVDDHISSIIPEHTGAVSATKKLHETYDPLKLKTTAPETLLTPSGIKGGKGAQTAREYRAASDPDMDAALEDYVVSQFNAKSVPAEKFLTDHADLLNEYPNVRGKLETLAKQEATAASSATASSEATTAASTSQKGLDKALAAQDKSRKQGRGQSAKRLRGLGKTTVREYSLKPQKTVQKMLKDPQSGQRFSSLNKRLTDAGKGEEFRGSVRKEVMQILHPEYASKPTAMPIAIDRFKSIRSQLVDSDVISKAEADKIATVLERTRTNVTSKEAISSVREEVNNEAARLGASVAAAQGATILPAGHSLMMVGALRRALLKHVGLKANPDPRVVDLLGEALTDPAMMKKLAKLTDEKQIDNLVSSRLAAIIAAEKPEEEQ